MCPSCHRARRTEIVCAHKQINESGSPKCECLTEATVQLKENKRNVLLHQIMGDASTPSDPEAPRLDQSSRQDFLSLRGKDAKFEYVHLITLIKQKSARRCGREEQGLIMRPAAGVPQRRLSASSEYRKTIMLSSRCDWV